MIDSYYYLSLGVGKQSTIIAVMIANKDPRLKEYWGAKFIFADTGAEEWHTYSYLHLVLKPYLEERGKEIITVMRGNGLEPEFDLVDKLPLGWVNPACSSFAKRDNIHKYYREEHGILNKSGKKYLHKKFIKIIELIGITTDEILRAKDSNKGWLEKRYPLIDLRLSRNDLDAIYKEYDLEIAKKSGCWFCPNKGIKHFINLKRTEPDRFDRLINWEERTSKARGNQLTLIYGTPLKSLKNQLSLDDFGYENDEGFSDQMCDSGYCMT